MKVLELSYNACKPSELGGWGMYFDCKEHFSTLWEGARFV